MSPSTQVFALFSVNPKILAHSYHLQLENTTSTPSNYSRESLDEDLLVLPDVYRVGMSGKLSFGGSVQLFMIVPQPFAIFQLSQKGTVPKQTAY